ncbi:MAG TPA: S9 family peptidase [Longimicrobiales bacterium]|nr:S9 family peptidase [Longimicrobiales bacterium]
MTISPLQGQVPVHTPNDADIPRPVPVELGLAGSDRPDIVRFLNVRTAVAPSLSPDGESLTFRTSVTGEPQLWVVAADGGWPRQLTFGEPVTQHAWSPSGEGILYAVDRGGNEREGYYLISPDGTSERELLAPSDAFRAFGGFTRDGSTIAYGSTERNGLDFDTFLLDVASGEAREVFRGRPGLYPVSWRPDGGAALLSEARGEDANALLLLDLETGETRTLFDTGERSSYDAFAWLPDGSAFYMVTNHGREYAGIARYDVEAGSLTWVEDPEARDVDGLALSWDGRYLLWSVNEGGYGELDARDLRTGAAVAPPDVPAGIYATAWAPGASVASVNVFAPGVPGDIWTWDPGAGRTSRATHSDAAGLDMARMAAPSAHSFPARDGTELYGLYYRPPGLPEGARPPVLLAVHGGPTAQARPTFRDDLQYLLTRGIAAFDLNYRGSTGFGKSYARLNDGRLREAEIYDLEDALEWLGRAGLADPDRAAVMGGSYGGYLTMAALARLPEVFRAGVAFVGVSNWVTALEGASPQLKASDRIEYGHIEDPGDRAFFHAISPIAHVDDVSAPIMVLHGANDPRDPVEESDQYVRALRELGGEVEYLRFPDEGHGIRRLANRIIAYRRVADFLEHRLGVEGSDAQAP